MVVETRGENDNENMGEGQSSYFFGIKKIIVQGVYVYNVGEQFSGSTLTTDRFSLTINSDNTIILNQDKKLVNGTFAMYGDTLVLHINEDDSTRTVPMSFDKVDNTISFTWSGQYFEYDLPQGLTFGDIFESVVTFKYANLGKVMFGENEFTVGKEVAGRVLEADSTYVEIYKNQTFKFVEITGSTRYGSWSLNEGDGSILIKYTVDTEYVITATFLENGTILSFEVDGFTYQLNVTKI